MNTVIVSTCEYMFVVTHEIHSMLVACYLLVHGNDNVIYTYQIQQIHILHVIIPLVHINDMFVSTCKY